MVFLYKEFFEKVNFEKKISAEDKKEEKLFPGGKELILTSTLLSSQYEKRHYPLDTLPYTLKLAT